MPFNLGASVIFVTPNVIGEFINQPANLMTKLFMKETLSLKRMSFPFFKLFQKTRYSLLWCSIIMMVRHGFLLAKLDQLVYSNCLPSTMPSCHIMGLKTPCHRVSFHY